MPDNKFNLNARIFQGYDPNTEFKENGTLFSTVRFADNSVDKEENLLDSLKSTTSNITNFFEGLLSGEGNDFEINSKNNLPFLPSSGPFQINREGSEYNDPLSDGSSSGQTYDPLSGLQSVGAGNGSFDLSNRALSLVQNIGGGTPETPTDPQDPPVVNPQLTAPVVFGNGSNTNEGDPIPLNILVLADTKPGVVTTVIISGVPVDATLSAGFKNPDGTWTLTLNQLSGLILTPDPHSSGQITLSVTATSTLNGLSASDTESIQLTIEGEASPPSLSVQNSVGGEDMAIALHITSALTDTDGSETLTITISNVPSTAMLSAGIKNPDGTWTLTPAQLTNLNLVPPHNFSGIIALTVSATSTENGTSSTVTQNLNVSVIGIADQPTLNVTAATGNENTNIPLLIMATLTDTDGSETLSITIYNIPAGASLSAGINNGDGSWTLTAAQLNNLQLIPPAHYSGNLVLDILATASEGVTHAYADAQLNVSIVGTATAPTLSTSPASGNEDTSVPLTISSSLIDTDGSETLSITVSGVPAGAILSAGINNGGGLWTLTPAQLANLSITPPLNYSGLFNLTVTATSSENGTISNTVSNLPVTIAGVPDLPTLAVQTANGNEGTATALNIAAALTDTDGSEILSVTISGVPAGAVLSAGTNNGGGVWTLTPAQLVNLTIQTPLSYNGSFNLSVVATASENSQSISTPPANLSVNISAVANAPVLVVLPGSGNEDTNIALHIQADAYDPMGGEILTIIISDLPAGASLSAGINNGNGSWTLTPAQLTNLQLAPPLNYSGNFNLQVVLISTDGGDTNQVSSPLPVSIAGVPDMPTLNVQNTSGNEGTPIALNITSALTDTDGSETLSITISAVPAGAVLSAGINNGGGVWTLTPAQLANLTLTPPANYTGNFNLGVIATASENNQSISTGSTSLSVTVNGVANAPNLNVHAVAGNEDTAIPLDISASLVDNDGSETLSITISGVPGAATLSAGINNGGGVWTLTPAQLVNLTLTPPLNFSGSFNLSVTATSAENSTTAQVTSNLPVTVKGVADTPTLSVQSATGAEDSAINLVITAGLTDTDGSEVLSIVVSGLPSGAHLSAGLNNGDGSWTLSPAQLSGLTLTPPVNFAGIIALQVSAVSTENNGDSTSLTAPATITVTPVADTPSLQVSAATGREDTAISLSISALLGDRDGSEILSVTITGVPTGATLSAGTNNGGGSWTLTAAQLANLKITPPLNRDNDFILNVTATATDSNGTTSSVIGNLPVTVLASADTPTVSATNTSGAKNTAVSLNISGAVTDTDGSETITYLISGVPDGFSLNHGTNNGNNSWTLSPADLSGLKMISPYNYEGRVHLTARSVSHDNDGSTAQSLPANFNVGVGNASGGIQLNLGIGIGIGGIGVGTALGVDVNLGGLLSPGGIVVHEDSIFPFVDAGLLLTLASSISFLNFGGLPLGASLSNGTDMGNGTWRLLPGDLLNLSITLPPNSDEDFTLTITAKLLILTVTLAVVDVHVIGVADTPTLSVANAIGNEDASSIAISVTSALTDTDGSETLSFMIKDLPPGFTPTIGINNGDGTWSLTAAQISSLALKPPANFSGDATFTILAVSTEREGDSTVQTAIGHIHVNPAADAPVITAVTHNGSEDTPLALNLGISLSDTDGSESISAITISGLSAGFSLTGATDNGNGTWSVNPSQINNVHLVSPANWSGDTSFTVTATSREGASGPTATTSATINAHIEAVADAPNVTAHDVTGIENQAISLNLSASLNDTDGSEHLSVVISNVPDHFIFSSGLNNGDGSWSFSQSQLNNLKMTAEENFTGDVHLNIDVFAQDSNNTIASTHADFIVHVTPDT